VLWCGVVWCADDILITPQMMDAFLDTSYRLAQAPNPSEYVVVIIIIIIITITIIIIIVIIVGNIIIIISASSLSSDDGRLPRHILPARTGPQPQRVRRCFGCIIISSSSIIIIIIIILTLIVVVVVVCRFYPGFARKEHDKKRDNVWSLWETDKDDYNLEQVGIVCRTESLRGV
jgi:uncharacterized membrane protein